MSQVLFRELSRVAAKIQRAETATAKWLREALFRELSAAGKCAEKRASALQALHDQTLQARQWYPGGLFGIQPEAIDRPLVITSEGAWGKHSRYGDSRDFLVYRSADQAPGTFWMVYRSEQPKRLQKPLQALADSIYCTQRGYQQLLAFRWIEETP